MNSVENFRGSKYHFPIVGIDEFSKKEILVGSCTLFNINGRIFLITASHVVNERHSVKNKELWIWNYSDRSKLTITEDIIGDPEAKEGTPHWCDVAVIELDLSKYRTFNTSEFWRDCFLEIDWIAHEIDISTVEGEELIYAVCGYPSSKNKILNGNYKPPQQLNFFTTKKPLPDFKEHPEHSEYSERLMLAVEWNSDNLENNSVGLPKPQGISGGGLWVCSTVSEYNPRFAGIIVAHDKSSNVVIAVKSAYVLSLIKLYFPSVEIPPIKLQIIPLGDEECPRFVIPME